MENEQIVIEYNQKNINKIIDFLEAKGYENYKQEYFNKVSYGHNATIKCIYTFSTQKIGIVRYLEIEYIVFSDDDIKNIQLAFDNLKKDFKELINYLKEKK